MSRSVSASRRSSSRISAEISPSTSASGGSRQTSSLDIARYVSTLEDIRCHEAQAIHLLIAAEPTAERPDEAERGPNGTECDAHLRFDNELEFGGLSDSAAREIDVVVVVREK